MGNVRATQGRFEESFNFHHRALVQYRSTVGNNHHRTADLCCKVAEGYIRLGQSTAAQYVHGSIFDLYTKLTVHRSLLDQALQIYRSRDHFKPELARTAHLRSKMLLLMGKETGASDAQVTALSLYPSIRPDEPRADEEISDADFDDIVCFASR